MITMNIWNLFFLLCLRRMLYEVYDVDVPHVTERMWPTPMIECGSLS